MSKYKFMSDNCVIDVATRRAIYLDQPATEHTEAYLAWVVAGGVADPADAVSLPDDTASAPDVRAEILNVSQKALASGFLHIIMFDMMQRYLTQAQAIVPSVTEADLLDVNSPHYSKAYADTRAYYVQLVALQDAK